MTYDIIIVGGGIAGLYCAFLLKKRHPQTNILLLEKSSRSDLGGRMGSRSFYGSQIAIGAGVGRLKKDILLQNLLKELHIPTRTFMTDTGYSSVMDSPCNVKKLFLSLKKEYVERKQVHGPIRKTFKEFAEPILGVDLYKQFIICAGYTDYEHEDIHDTLYYYGFEDNYNEFECIGIPWSQLVHAMVKQIGADSIKCLSQVTSLTKKEDIYTVSTKTREYDTKKVVFATTIETVKKLLGTRFPIYQQIHGQPFMRIYGKFSKASIPIMNEFVTSHVFIVPGPIHKIIPMNRDTGVYMIVYTDNKGATYLKKYKENTERNRSMLCKLLEKAIGAPSDSLSLIAITDFYWSVGTHYYEPLRSPYTSRKQFIKEAQHPDKTLYVVGEMISMNQGWVEGALESVHQIIDHLSR